MDRSYQQDKFALSGEFNTPLVEISDYQELALDYNIMLIDAAVTSNHEPGEQGIGTIVGDRRPSMEVQFVTQADMPSTLGYAEALIYGSEEYGDLVGHEVPVNVKSHKFYELQDRDPLEDLDSELTSNDPIDDWFGS